MLLILKLSVGSRGVYTGRNLSHCTLKSVHFAKYNLYLDERKREREKDSFTVSITREITGKRKKG